MAIAYGVAAARSFQDPAATSILVSYPATVNAGDLLIMHIITNGGAVTTPAGWTAMFSEATVANPKGGVWYKIAAGTETGTLTVAMASTTACAIMYTFTGVNTTTPLDAGPTSVSNTVATLSSSVIPSVTTVTAGALLFWANGINSGTARTNSTGTELFDFGLNGGTATKGGSAFWELIATPAATGTRTTNQVDSAGAAVARANWGAMAAFRPAAAASGPQTATPTAISLSAAEGTPTLTAPATAAPGGIALASTAGTPTLAAAATVAPGGVSLTAAEGTPAVTAGPVTAAPAGVGLLANEGTPVATTATLTAPPGIGLTASRGTPAVSTAVLSAPGGVQLAAGTGTPVAGAAVLTAPGGVGLLAAAGTPAVAQTTPGTNSTPTGVALTAAEGTPTATTRATAVPAGIALAATPAVPVLASSLRALPGSVGAITQEGTPNVSTGLTGRPGGIVISAVPGNPSRILSFSQTVRPAGQRRTASAGAPTVAIYSRILVGIIVETKRWAASARAVKKAEADTSYTSPATRSVTRWEGKPYESR